MECARTKAKHQTPSTKLQRSSKFQAPNQGLIDLVAIQDGALMFGAWNFSGAWSLEFEASQPSHSTETNQEPIRFWKSANPKGSQAKDTLLKLDLRRAGRPRQK